MKRVSKHFEVEDCCFFRAGAKYLTEIPHRMEIKYYEYDEDTGMYIGVLRKKVYITELLLIIFCIVSVTFMLMHKQTTHYVNITNTVYYTDGYISLNVMNSSSNSNSIIVQLLYDGKAITEKYRLEPGRSIGNVKVAYGLKKGSYMCNLKYIIERKRVNVEKDYNVLLVVE